MRKFLLAAYVVLMAALVLSLSGCGSSSSSLGSDSGTSGGSSLKDVQVATISVPSLQIGGKYQIYKGAEIPEMDDTVRYFVASGMNESNAATVNLGFAESLDKSDTLVIEDESGKVVFAFQPSGEAGKGTTSAAGTVTRTGGKRLTYNGQKIGASSFTASALDVDTSGAKTIVLNADGTATFDGESVSVYDYVWHADPDHPAEYWTKYGDTSEELDEDGIAEVVGDDEVYIMHDIRYTPDTLGFSSSSKTATKTDYDDDGKKTTSETEYVVYYNSDSEAVKSAIADIVAEKGEDFGGDYIFATLPIAGGGATPPGGQVGNMGMNSSLVTPAAPPQRGNVEEGPGGQNGGQPSGNSGNTDYFTTMTHSAADAYENPVLHINKAGTYRLQGTWNGQIWIYGGKKSNEDAKVVIILDNVTVTCGVAPALVFYNCYECGPDDEDEVAGSWKTLGLDVLENAGAKVLIADGTTNTFTGANVYRILKLEPKDKTYVTGIDGSEIAFQKKLYKMDGAFYSFRSMAIGGGTEGTGKLNITSTTYEGLDAELHMAISGGNITVSAPDDGINVNEDNISVFDLEDGTLTITSQGGDGIDSNGYAVVNGGTLNITAGSQKEASAGEAGIDAEKGTHIADEATYTWNQISSQQRPNDQTSTENPENPGGNNGQQETSDGDTQDNTQTTVDPIDPIHEKIIVTDENGNESELGTFDIDAPSGEDYSVGNVTRNIPESSSTFELVQKVNNFSRITD